MKNINYFDLGLGPYPHEMKYMINDVFTQFTNITYKSYGIEAHPKYVQTAKELFKNKQNVEIFNFAISDKKGTERLYLQKNENDGGIGNSIFKTKYNVDSGRYIEVDSNTFSSFIIENDINLRESINILKVNIEGAELYLWEDFKKNNLRDEFKIICGYKDHDILKVKELNSKYDHYINLMNELNIKILHFCNYGGKNLAINNMINAISSIL